MRSTRALVAAAVVVTLLGASAVVVGLFVLRGPARGEATEAPGTATPCPTKPFDCGQSERFAAARALAAKAPGYLGIVVRDRHTGGVWRSGHPARPVWTASTIKLAMAVGLLERHRFNQITLDDATRKDIADMLSFSSNDAADRLWNRYGRSSMVGRFRNVYGMKGLTFVSGYSRYWGLMKCTADDLAALMTYILDKVNLEDRAYIMDAMRRVEPIQQWGVWAAGPDMSPGVKGGWSTEDDPGGKHWVVNSVGFAGDGERYVVAVMYHLPPKTGTLDAGVHAVSDVIATALGAPVPAPVVIPDRD